MFVPELFNQSVPKIMAVMTIAGSVLGEMAVSATQSSPAPWEHLTLLGALVGGLLWLVRERAIDKKEHIEAQSKIESKLDSLQTASHEFREKVITANTAALESAAQSIDKQNEFFQTITQGVVSDAFAAGRKAEKESPSPKTSKQTPR